MSVPGALACIPREPERTESREERVDQNEAVVGKDTRLYFYPRSAVGRSEGAGSSLLFAEGRSLVIYYWTLMGRRSGWDIRC